MARRAANNPHSKIDRDIADRYFPVWMNYANSRSFAPKEERVFRYSWETGIIREFESDFGVSARKQFT